MEFLIVKKENNIPIRVCNKNKVLLYYSGSLSKDTNIFFTIKILLIYNHCVTADIIRVTKKPMLHDINLV